MKIEAVKKYRVGDEEFDTLEEARAARFNGDYGTLANADAAAIKDAVLTGKGDVADAITRIYSKVSRVRAAAKKPADGNNG
ncbi:MAG: hypothetical protein ACRCXM_11500 [Beijerinckiaceae bacterium]